MERVFSAFRYLITENKGQYDLFKSNKEQLVKNVFDQLEANQKTIWTNGSRKYIFAGVERFQNLMFIKFAKNVSTKIYKETAKDISTEKLIEPKFIHLIIDETHQIILVENNTQIFQKAATSAKLFSKFVEHSLNNDHFKINVYPLATTDKFWKEVNHADSIYRLKLEFNAPNMALFAGRTTQRILKLINEETNNEEVDLDLKNSKGNLKVRKKGLGVMIDYIREVGGDIVMKYKADGDGRMKVFKSKEDVFTTPVKVDDDKFTDETKIRLLDIFSKISKLVGRK